MKQHRPERSTFDPSVVVDAQRPGRAHTPVVTRQVAVLERNAPRVVEKARLAGVDLTYEGIAPLFNKPIVYAGDTTDWVVRPLSPDLVPVMPRQQARVVDRLKAADVYFPLIYEAHECEKGSFPGSPDALPGSMATVTNDQATELVGPVPVPRETVETAERLNERAAQVFRGLRRGAVLAGTATLAAAAAPFVLVGAAAGAVTGLDPVIFGVIPAVSARVGEPAAWYVIAKWNW